MGHKIGVAVIGVGEYGRVHARVYSQDPRVQLIAVWSRTEARARAVAEQFGCRYVRDWSDIASDAQIQIVSIATPDFAHSEPTLAMIKAGKHVLIEKPMAMSKADCEQIIAASVKAGTKLMVNFHNRWYPAIAEAKKRVLKGEIGSIVAAYARLSDRISVATEMLRTWSAQSGPHWFLFPHLIDLIHWFTGQKPSRVFASGTKGVLSSKGIDTYDVVQAQVLFDQTIATIESSWIMPNSWRHLIDFVVDLQGTEGKISINGDREGLEVASIKPYETPFTIFDPTEAEPIIHFIDCVLYDQQPSCTGEDGLLVTATIEAIEQSLNTGQPILVKI